MYLSSNIQILSWLRVNDLLIKTQLKKPISEYKSESPHVTIAKKLKEQEKEINKLLLVNKKKNIKEEVIFIKF